MEDGRWKMAIVSNPDLKSFLQDESVEYSNLNKTNFVFEDLCGFFHDFPGQWRDTPYAPTPHHVGVARPDGCIGPRSFSLFAEGLELVVEGRLTLHGLDGHVLGSRLSITAVVGDVREEGTAGQKLNNSKSYC